MINFVVSTCVMCLACVKRFIHMYELPGCLKFFKVKQWFGLNDLFWDGIDLSNKRNEDKKLLFFTSITLFYVHQNLILIHHCTNETKKGKTR